jgi:hypothetical protein
LQEVHVKSSSRKNRQKFRYQFSLDFWVLSRFRVFLSDLKNVSKSFYKTIDKKNPYFSRLSLSHAYGRFSVRGGQKKISKKSLTNPGTFLASEEPTNHVKVRRFFFGPLGGSALGLGFPT